ncbi:SRPBCC family protein [Nocardioides sp. MH1]|uniref:SRPBCC family protein n=1 Tax=Nocardioides sp. MH1 TaxID=3242490 RepID=UPI003520A8DE
MDLTHRFTVPTGVEETWAHFQDIASVAQCFPGAQVTSVETVEGVESFTGTCKVKLGPIALVYAGSGHFVERDEADHRFVVEAKGRDKRGNGTAGATVTLTMAAAGEATDVQVVTDLAITGKPAQFGRGVMQDVSDKLLGQFVACLEQRLTADGSPADAADQDVDQDAGPASVPTGAAAVAQEPGADPDAGPASAPAPAPAPPLRPSPPAADDALDLGATVLPVLLKSYRKQLVAGVLGLLALRWVLRRLRR